MKQKKETDGGCSADPEAAADLVKDDVLQLTAGERLWKLCCFRPESGQATDLRHRIYTKLKADGNLALVTFAVHTPTEDNPVRSAIARVPDLTVDAFDHLIHSIVQQTSREAVDYEELDLSNIPTLEEQIDYLRAEHTGHKIRAANQKQR